MARSRTTEPGWIASLLGAAVLIAGGFLVGLVVGVVSEEPDLVVEHIAGGSEEVAWDADRPGLPDVASAPQVPADVPTPDLAPAPDVAPAAEAAPMPEALGSAEAASPEPRLARAAPAEPAAAPPVPAPREAPEAAPAPRPRPAAGGFAVQVGAFGDSATAERLADDLEEKGFPSYVTAGAGVGRWRVRVGPVASRDEADALAGRLQGEHGLPTWVLSEGPR